MLILYNKIEKQKVSHNFRLFFRLGVLSAFIKLSVRFDHCILLAYVYLEKRSDFGVLVIFFFFCISSDLI